MTTAAETVLQAVRAWMVAVAGVSAAKVIPADDVSVGPRPAKPYWTVKVTSPRAGDLGPAERIDGLITTYALVINTATDGEVYGVSLTSPSAVAITHTAAVSSTPATISAGLAAAWSANATTAAACAADGTTTPGTVRFTNLSTRTAYALAEGANAAKMTLSAATGTPAATMQERREATVSVQGFGTGAAQALDDLALLVDSPLSLSTQQAQLVTIMIAGGPTDTTQLLDTAFEPRSLLELRVRFAWKSSAVAQVAVGTVALDIEGVRFDGDPDPLSIDDEAALIYS